MKERPDFQLSKTVFILARFCPNKLFKSADKECLILVPLSDLFRRRDFYGFGRFEISLFLPFLRLDARRRFQFLCAKMGHFFFLIRSFSADQNTNIISRGYDECLNSMGYSIKAFLSHFLIGFSWWRQPRLANLNYTGQQMS